MSSSSSKYPPPLYLNMTTGCLMKSHPHTQTSHAWKHISTTLLSTCSCCNCENIEQTSDIQHFHVFCVSCVSLSVHIHIILLSKVHLDSWRKTSEQAVMKSNVLELMQAVSSVWRSYTLNMFTLAFSVLCVTCFFFFVYSNMNMVIGNHITFVFIVLNVSQPKKIV